MKIIIFLVLTYFSFFAQAANQYQIDEQQLQNPSTVKYLQMKSLLSKFDFHSFSDYPLVQSGFKFDWMFTRNQLQQAILIKEGLIAPNDWLNKIMTNKDGTITTLHLKFKKSNFMILAIGISKEDLGNIFQELMKKKSASYFSLFIDQAQAANCSARSRTTKIPTASLELEAITHTIGKCAFNSLNGLGQSSAESFSFFKEAITDPEKIWHKMQTSFVEFKNLVINFREEFASIYTELKDLPSEQRTQLICTMTGQLLGATSIAILTGAGLAKVLPSLLLKLKAAAAVIKNAIKLTSKGILLPVLSTLTEKAILCAI